ncbi:polyketide synthase dehydratase domain-containing protein, partial [Streptomyces alanosinicus]|uniref:polyketide synthase dehydratase domain-containing protein n=1 Tax=Streptomyces alanosinicus TaxID=68171 RepID=UPI00167BF8A3
TEEELLPHLTETVGIAAINSPSSVVISGVEADVESIAADFAGQGRKTTRLRVSHAFHSPLMDPALADFRAVAETVTYNAPSIPVVSGVHGEITDEWGTPDYWTRHLREAVRFADTVTYLHSKGITRFLELGPDAILTALTRTTLDEAVVAEGVVRKNRPETHTLLTAVGRLFTVGTRVDWGAFYAGTGARHVDLPTYPFQRERFWIIENQGGGDPSALGLAAADHPLLGAVVSEPDSDGVVLTGRLALDTHPWLADHDVLGTVLLPGTGFVELALYAGGQIGNPVLEELILQAPLVLPEQGGVALRVTVGAEEAGERTIRIHSREERPTAEWLLHAEGVLTATPAAPPADLTVWPPAGAAEVRVADAYELLFQQGYDYGPVFQGLTAVWRDGETVFAEVALPEHAHDDAAEFGVHPALLDATMHALGVGEHITGDEPTELPFSWSQVALHASGATALRVRVTKDEVGNLTLDLADSAGAPVATVGSLAFRPVSQEQLSGGRQESLHEI